MQHIVKEVAQLIKGPCSEQDDYGQGWDENERAKKLVLIVLGTLEENGEEDLEREAHDENEHCDEEKKIRAKKGGGESNERKHTRTGAGTTSTEQVSI